MPYATAEVDALLQRLATAPKVVTTVRTDAVFDGNRIARQDIHLERAQKKRLVVPLRQRGAERARCARQIEQFLNAPATEADQLYGVGEALAALNPVGSWFIGADPPGRTIRFCEDLPPLVEDAVGELHFTLRAVSAIWAESLLVSTDLGFKRRRVNVRFVGADGHELAAIDTAHFSQHLQSLLFNADPNAERNRQRAAHWAAQLDIDEHKLARVLHALNLLTVVLPISRIELLPRA